MDRNYKQSSACRHWCLTINNPEEGTRFLDCLDVDMVKYYIVGQEVGDMGTEHEQVYVCFKKKQRFSAVKRMFPHAHIEQTKGTPSDNREYCSKEGNFEEYGELPLTAGEAERERWQRTYDLAVSGKHTEIEPRILVQYYGNIRRIMQDNPVHVPNLDGDFANLWLYGPPGVGKSRHARELAPVAYIKSCSKWWDGYRGQEDVIIDDFDQMFHMLGHHLKIWADRYAFPAEIKGTSLLIRPKRIIITSNYHPNEIWRNPSMLAAICRRFSIILMDPLGVQRELTRDINSMEDIKMDDYLGFLNE